MRQNTPSGIRLRSREKEAAGWLLQTMVSVLALVAEVLIFTQLSGFGQGGTVGIMVVAGGYLCVIYGILTKFRKQRWFFPVVLLMMLTFCLIFRQGLLAGYCGFFRKLSDTVTAGTGRVLPELEPPEWNEDTANILFSLMCGGGMGLFSCFFVRFAPAALAVILPGIAMVGLWLLGQTSCPAWFVAVASVSGILLLSGGRKRKATFSSVLPGWCGWGAMLCILLVCFSGMDSWAENLSHGVRQTLHQYRYETEYTVLPEGDLSGTPAENAEPLPGLVVTMSHGEKMYLRGVAGCTFADGVWTPISTQSLAQEKELLYWLNRNAFSLNAQFEGAAQSLDLETATVTVENVGGCSENLYVPYTLCHGDWLSAENLNPDAVSGQGSRSYHYSVVAGGTEAISQVLSSLQTGDDEWIHQYRQAESAYRSFVYDNYLSVPEDVEALLLESWDAIGETYGDSLTLAQAQSCVLEYLDSYPDDLLLPDWAGTSYQYATVAVLTARHFGIPARYAEGYVISEGMAESDVAINVDSSCAGAWAEVYQDGIGWIPMDLLPGMEADAPRQQSVPKPEDPEQTHQDTPTGQSPSEGRAFLNAGNWLWILQLMLLVCLFFLGRRQYIRRKIARRFRLEDPKEAVGWIFADTAMLLEAMGLSRGNGSMYDLCKPARERFGEEYETALTNCIRLNELALFSSRELTDAHRETQLTFRMETLKKLRKETKWHRRFRLKWLHCLY